MASGLTFEEKFNKIYFRNPLKMEKALKQSIAQYESSKNISDNVKNRIAQLNNELEQLKTVPAYLYQFHNNEPIKSESLNTDKAKELALKYKYKALAQMQELELLK